MVCNNAGVAGGGGIDHISLDNWRWVLDVNLMGVLHGIERFLPHIRAHGEGGHIVNTASMAGMQRARVQPLRGRANSPSSACPKGSPCNSSHTASASVCCARAMCVPASARAARNRPERYGRAAARSGEPGGGHGRRDCRKIWRRDLTRSDVAARVLAAIREDELYMFTHPDMRAEVEGRFAAILAAMDKVGAE